METRHGLSSHRRALPALVCLAIVGAAIAGSVAIGDMSGRPSDAEVRAAAASEAAATSARLEADGRLLTAAALSIGGDARQPVAPLLAGLRRIAPPGQPMGVAPVAADGTAIVTVAVPEVGSSIVGLNLATAAKGKLLLDLARDQAGPVASALPSTGGPPMVLDVLALYGAADVPADVGARRAALQGFVVTLTPASTLVGLTGVTTSDISVRVIRGDTVLAAAGRGASDRPPASAVTLPLTTNGVTWTVQAWATAPSSRLPLVVLVGGVVLGLVVAALLLARERRIAIAMAEVEARNQELALVARAGPLLQQSLALGDLLPVFVVEIADELGFDGISISLCSESGQLVRMFSLGAGATSSLPDIDTLSAPPPSIAPGGSVAVPLQRAGRVVGVFQARAVKGLAAPQMDTLQAVCALLAAAIGNVRLFQEERDMVTRLRDVDRMKTSFIGSVSHELRTSVTAIQGFAGLLEANVDLEAERRADYVERISRNARSLGVLIEDLLDFARFERSGLAVALGPVDLSELVPSVVDQMSSVLHGRPVSMTIEPGVVALADAQAIERILANLLSNAGKYTPEGSEVVVALDHDDDNAILSVCDHGPGIPVAEREKVFELFYRSDDSARTTRGVGIGLSLTRQLVAHLNGTITVDDAPGGGARFRVTIPLAPTSPPPPVVAAADAPEHHSGG